MRTLSLSHLLKKSQSHPHEFDFEKELESLQNRMLTIQQSIWHRRERVILVFEGFDASGKGGVIQRITEKLDPRGFRVHATSAPDPKDQAKHYLYRFWERLPEPGTIALFDRSWYGRVLVERVEELTPEKRWKEAYDEINGFEELLAKDGVRILKFFLAVSKKEQLQRYEDRLKDPYKRWKLTEDDIRNRKNWKASLKAVDEMLAKTSTKTSPWHLIPSDHKASARNHTLSILTEELASFENWMKSEAANFRYTNLKKALKKLES